METSFEFRSGPLVAANINPRERRQLSLLHEFLANGRNRLSNYRGVAVRAPARASMQMGCSPRAEHARQERR